MRRSDLFSTNLDEISTNSHAQTLRVDLIKEICIHPVSLGTEVEVATILVELLHYELKNYGTSGPDLIVKDEEIEILIMACRASCRRIGVAFPDLPFRNYSSFRRYWNDQGMRGSWAARVDYLDDNLGPVRTALLERSMFSWEDHLIKPVTPRRETGWAHIDQEVQELRARFGGARTNQDHCAVGTACVRIIELVSDTAYDPTFHSSPDVPFIESHRTKDRLEAVIAKALHGSENEKVRKFVRSLLELSHSVKHKATPTRFEAGVASDAVVAFVNIMRRIDLNVNEHNDKRWIESRDVVLNEA